MPPSRKRKAITSAEMELISAITRIKWQDDPVVRKAADPRVRIEAAARLIANVEGYEGDYALHVLNADQLVLIVRDADKRLIVYDCYVERRGIAEERETPPEKPGEDEPVRVGVKDWF